MVVSNAEPIFKLKHCSDDLNSLIPDSKGQRLPAKQYKHAITNTPNAIVCWECIFFMYCNT